MYIRQIVLDGFKTYQNRTTISGFDPQFNAITGLNGSGKSNILDSIQFLLGSNCKQMLRLKSNMSELIYKEGYAGITKATVAIRFACPDRNMRPAGYEDCQELLITRQISKDHTSKFFINGTTSTQTKVKNLFRSVSLNIDNPHFLVKQGQITKIINLKPLELLGMIEETAGTAYYNKIKQESENTMAKKEQKLRMIDDLLINNLQPQIDKIRREKEEYQAWRAGQNKLKEMGKKLKLFQWKGKEKRRSELEINIAQSRNAITNKSVELSAAQEQLRPLIPEIQSLKAQLIPKTHNDFQKLRTEVNNRETQRVTLLKRLDTLRQEIDKTHQKLQSDEIELDSAMKNIQWLKAEADELERDLAANQNLLKEMNSSKAQKGASDIFQRQCEEYQNKLKNIKSQIQALQQKQSMLQSQRDNQRNIKLQMDNNRQKMLHEKKQLQARIDELKRREPPVPVPQPQSSQNQAAAIQTELRKLYNSNYIFNFSYKVPYEGFPKEAVRGRLFMLIRVKDRKHEKAIEIGVGGKLYNVVTDNEHVSQALIDSASFGSNTSYIPNNKMRSRVVPNEIKNQCMKIANQLNGMAVPAMDLVDYPKDLQNAIDYGLGNFVVCSNTEIAKRIAFHGDRSLRIKCVTFDGQTIDPAGTFTGGHIAPNSSMLSKYEQVRRLEAKLKEHDHATEASRKEYEKYRQLLKEYDQSRSQIETKQNRIRMIEDKFGRAAAVNRERNYDQQLSDISSRLVTLGEEQEALKSRLDSLKKQLKDNKGNSTNLLKQQKKQLQSEIQQKRHKLNKNKKQISKLQLKIDQKKSDIESQNKNREEYESDIKKISQKANKIAADNEQNKFKLRQLEQECLRVERQNAKAQGKLKNLTKQYDYLKKQVDELSLDIKKAQHVLEDSQKEIKDIQVSLNKLQSQNKWLTGDDIGQILRDFDQINFNYEQSKKQYDKYRSEQDLLKKSINFNVEASSEKTQLQFNELISKQRTLKQDKLTLLTNISDLDIKRKDTLQKCYEQVKTNLQKIFTDLLPGAVARLKLVDQNDVTQGCQLSVEFDKVKKSLNELSGGQRSLLALSFILSLLLYKPSPFYILDEIDSALDQSHTENIGFMISQRFPQSQFIIISLKEGMFSNANILLKVSFVDGQSKVERQQLRIKK